MKLESEHFDHGLEDAFATEHFGLNGALYDITAEFQSDFEPDKYGLVYTQNKKGTA